MDLEEQTCDKESWGRLFGENKVTTTNRRIITLIPLLLGVELIR